MTHIIPAIDLMNGSCVRLSKGDYNTKKEYSEDPLKMAKSFEDAGAQWIHLVDLDAARKDGNNLDVIKAIAQNTSLKVEMGGGIRGIEKANEILDFGVSRIIIGSLAVKKKEVVFDMLKKWGSDRIVIGADVNNEYLATDGWYETSNLHIDSFVKEDMENGGQIFLCTDIAKDGMLEGTSNKLYARIMEDHKGIKLIASGGVSNINDINLIREMNMFGVVVGKAIYEGKIKLEDLFLDPFESSQNLI